MTAELTVLTERITRLERQNRRAKQLAGACVLCLGLGVLVGAQDQKPRTLEAEKLVLMDAKGKPRAMLEVSGDVVSFVMRDEKGEDRIGIGVNNDGPGIYLTDPGKKHRAVLSRNNEGVALHLLGENGKAVIDIQVTPDQSGVALLDEKGNRRAAFVNEKDGTGLYMLDEKEQRRGLLRFDNKVGIQFGMFDQKGKLTYVLPPRRTP